MACNVYNFVGNCNFVGFQLILSLVSAFKAKPDPAICRGCVVERLLRVFEFKTWREMYIILLDFS